MMDSSSRAFIFDMDGTLIDNMRFHTRAWQTMLAENGVDLPADDFLVKTAGKTNREILPSIFRNILPHQLTELGERKETLYREFFLPHRQTVNGVVEFLEATRGLGIKTAVATAAPVKNVEFILDGLDLRKYFDAVTTAADVSEGKPNPEIFLRSAEKIGIDPVHCLVFEDALNGFEAAVRAGMKAVAITTVSGRELLESLEGVVEVIADFTDITPSTLIEKYLPEAAARGRE
jgi:beta-phosphoglucomutase family hydrolase